MAILAARQKIVPFLWFNQEAKEAAAFYCTVFQRSKIISSNPFVTVFELEGLQVHALNGGPHFQLNESFSFVVNCDTQDEIDYYWTTLCSDGGKESRCGWLKDKFGLSWQIVPTVLGELMNDADKAPKVTAAFMQMTKFDLAKILAAAE